MYIMYNVYTTVVFFILYFFYVFWYPPTFATSTELMNQSIFPFSICMVAMPDKKKKTNPPTLPVEGDIWAASNAPQACVVWGFNSGDWYGSLAWIYAIWHTEGQPNRNIHTGNWSRYYKLNIFVMSIQYQHVRLLVYHYVQMYILHIYTATHTALPSRTRIHTHPQFLACYFSNFRSYFFFVDVTPDVLSKHLAICARHTLLQTTSHAHPSELNYNAAIAWRFVCSRITFSHSKILWRREKRLRVSRKERWDEEKKNPNRVYNKCRSHFFTISHNTHASSYSCSVCIFHINSGMRSGL